MSDWRDDPRILTVPVIRLAFALSIALHAAVLWGWLPRVHNWSFERDAPDRTSGPLVVDLDAQSSRAASARPASPPPSTLQVPQSPAKRAPRPKAAARPPPPPPVMVQEGPAPAIAPAPPIAPPPEAPSAAAPALTPVEGDFASYLEARRRARGAAPDGGPSLAQAEDERERHNRLLNLGLDHAPTFGSDRTGGGIFRIEEMDPDYAEFTFFGWNKDIRRNSKLMIEVRKGDNSDIRIAVVRRMIAIIRETQSGDFDWVSMRLRRHVTLSARLDDNAGLEDFLMQEFFTATDTR